MTTTITEYSATDSALAELRQKYATVVFDVTNGKGMEQAKKARAELREHRVSLEKGRVRIKAPALERCRQIDSEAKRITAELEALESPIDFQIKSEEERKAREKEAREQAERERIAAINARFDAIRALPLAAVGASSAAIAEQIAAAELIDPATFPDEMKAAAEYEKRLAITALRAAQDRALSAEAEAEKTKAERAELERLRTAHAELLAKQERMAAEERERVATEERRQEEQARAEREAVERAAREAREDEERRIDAERAEARRKEDAERAAEQQRLADERVRLDAEKRAAEKREREQAIANATTHTAIAEAIDLLRANGFADHIVTKKLEAVIAREPMAAAA